MRVNSPNPLPAVPDFSAARRPSETTVREAEQALLAAICYAAEHQLLPLIKDALAAGASLDYRDSLGRDLLTIAVALDRPHALATLLALGARMPEVPEDGIDLMMQAATLDHDECCRILLNPVDMDADALDNEGRSALFHAVVSGAVASALVLLDAGADMNLCTTDLSPNSLNCLFCRHLLPAGREVTPLMVAAASNNKAMMNLLIRHGADPNLGDLPPLHIAAIAHDADMIAYLLAQGASLTDSVNWNTETALVPALANHAPIDCLRLLAKDYPFHTDDAQDPDQLLRFALQLGRTDAVALFLGLGAKPAEHQVDDRASLWRLAIDGHHGHQAAALEVLDLMATTKATCWASREPDGDEIIFALDAIRRAEGDLAAIADSGLYPSLLSPLQLALTVTPAGTDWHWMNQWALHAAGIFLSLAGDATPLATSEASPAASSVAPSISTSAAPTAPPAASPADAQPAHADALWQQRTTRGRDEQAAWLRQAATQWVESNKAALQQALTLPFFMTLKNSCPEDARLEADIKAHLLENTGLPTNLINGLASTWMSSASEARHLLGDEAPAEQAMQFVWQRMLLHTARWVELALPAVGDTVSASWMRELQQMATGALALKDFANQPVHWLMLHEQRLNLRPVAAPELAGALCVQLGLPPDTAIAIAEAWAGVIAQLADGSLICSPAEKWRTAARAFSPALGRVLVEDTALVLPRSVRDGAERWCVQQNGPLPGRVSIPVLMSAQAEAPPEDLHEPPRKKSRHS